MYYQKEVKEVLKSLDTSDSGLDASLVNERLQKYGKNKLEDEKKESKIRKFLNEFKDLMIIILIITAIVSFGISIYNHESFIDSIIIILIVIINAIMGFVEELNADNAIEELKNAQSTKAKVRRNNKVYVINSEDLVIGDIILLESGDKIPADARIISASFLQTDESPLTGESQPVVKDNKAIKKEVGISQRSNMLYSGCSVVYGKCEAVVTDTGMKTEFGRIAESLNTLEKETTPLQKKINEISKSITLVIIIIIVVMLIIGLIKGMDLLEVVMLSISLAVAAIPEGLPAIITIILSLGMKSLASKNAIVRKLSSIETLGCTEVICSDKTGTITQNKMEVKELVYNNKVKGINELNEDNILYKIMTINNEAIQNDDSYIGDPTEIALLEHTEKYANIDVSSFQKIGDIPFDSDRKMSSTVVKYNNKIYLYTKGSFESIISRCKYTYLNDNVKNLSKLEISILKNLNDEESSKAYRVLAYAYKELEDNYKLDESNENDLIFVGLTSLIDPPREDVKEAIECCKKAHIRPVMITGDNIETAIAIAKEVDILEERDEAITGTLLDKMTQYDLEENINKYNVYARVSPNNKLSIVEAFKNKGYIVAMTGDGVNDAPAIKSANIGIGMGITGTEVSKSVSDIVLTDDSFSTIVSAIKEGRRIYDNIRNVIVYLLTSNIAEVIVVAVGMLLGIEIFIPIQLLFINLVTDSIPAISLAYEKESEDIMAKKPRRQDEPFFTNYIKAKMTISSILKGIAILFIYFINRNIFDENIATSASFLALVLIELLFAYSCKNIKKNVINKDLFNNNILNISILILLIIQVLIFISPLKNIFGLTSLSLIQVIYIILIVLIAFIIEELLKSVLLKLFKD